MAYAYSEIQLTRRAKHWQDVTIENHCAAGVENFSEAVDISPDRQRHAKTAIQGTVASRRVAWEF
jgi:hypothetical protein